MLSLQDEDDDDDFEDEGDDVVRVSRKQFC
jgi:hypothetical protein